MEKQGDIQQQPPPQELLGIQQTECDTGIYERSPFEQLAYFLQQGDLLRYDTLLQDLTSNMKTKDGVPDYSGHMKKDLHELQKLHTQYQQVTPITKPFLRKKMLALRDDMIFVSLPVIRSSVRSSCAKATLTTQAEAAIIQASNDRFITYIDRQLCMLGTQQEPSHHLIFPFITENISYVESEIAIKCTSPKLTPEEAAEEQKKEGYRTGTRINSVRPYYEDVGDISWMRYANCRTIDPDPKKRIDVMFTSGPSKKSAAVCAACVCKKACEQYAVNNNITTGTWNGKGRSTRSNKKTE
jgi:Transcription factor WhiB